MVGGMKKSMVASTSTRLINRLPNQACTPTGQEPHDNQQDQPSSRNEAESEEEEDQNGIREKTPDTNVKLNQPLRCGRYGQDLLPNKQQHTVAAEKAQSQDPRLGAGGKANPALIASRQSTSAAPVVGKTASAKVPKLNVKSSALPPCGVPPVQPDIGQLDGAGARHPVQVASNAPASRAAQAGGAAPASLVPASRAAPAGSVPAGRAAPPGPAPASVDELLTGPIPRGNIMTASMAGAAAAMAESAAAMASGTAADREAVKAALGHHYRQYRAKKAAAEERAKAAPPKPQAASAAAADKLAGTTKPDPTGVPVSKASDSKVVSQQQQFNVRFESSQQPNRLHYDLDTAGEQEEIPLRVKYGTSSSGGSSQACSSRSRDTATSYSFGQQPPQQQHAQQQHAHSMQAGQSRVGADQHQTPSRIHYKHSGAAHAQQSEAQPQQNRQLHQQPHVSVSGAGVQLPAPREVEEVQLAGATSAHEKDMRRSNEKLDMLLQSTVKRTQQAVSGKENKVSHLHAKIDAMMSVDFSRTYKGA